MSRKKVSTTIYITPEQADRLKLLHERTKVPISVYIREGIDMVLKHYEHVLPGQMSLENASTTTPPAPPVAVSRKEQPVADGGSAPRPTLRTGAASHAAAVEGGGAATGHHGPRSGSGSGEGG